MSAAARLADELDAFARIIDELAGVAARSDPSRRSELIALRKRLSDHIVLMRATGIQAFDDPALASAFRSRLSTVLNGVAMHQANWPAVSIDRGNAAYRRSAANVATSNRTFIEWTRAALEQCR